MAEGATDPTTPQRSEGGARSSHRRVVMTTCQGHGTAGFTNLLVTKEDGVIVLNPHVANCCVLRLDEQAARALLSILGEWLG
jgi:hypothetical protein